MSLSDFFITLGRALKQLDTDKINAKKCIDKMKY